VTLGSHEPRFQRIQKFQYVNTDNAVTTDCIILYHRVLICLDNGGPNGAIKYSNIAGKKSTARGVASPISPIQIIYPGNEWQSSESTLYYAPIVFPWKGRGQTARRERMHTSSSCKLGQAWLMIPKKRASPFC
jgi:hypothetical protein